MAKSHSKKAFDGRVIEWKNNTKEAKKKAEVEKHFLPTHKIVGNIIKCGSSTYAKNGYFQVDGIPGRKSVYERSAVASKNYGSSNDNFFSLKKPYPLQAHHILPKDSFSTTKGFTEQQRTLLKRVPWDLNHGENIILLPERRPDCPIHQLPAHRGSHRTYNSDVYKDTGTIQAMLKKQPPCSTDGPQLKIAGDLKTFQDKWWDWLADKCYTGQGKGTVEEAAASGIPH